MENIHRADRFIYDISIVSVFPVPAFCLFGYVIVDQIFAGFGLDGVAISWWLICWIRTLILFLPSRFTFRILFRFGSGAVSLLDGNLRVWVRVVLY